MVRIDPAGRGTAAVKVVCIRPSCPSQRLPTVAEGRRFAAAHLAAHLRAGTGPRADAYCACKLEHCHLHIDQDSRVKQEPWRCGGAVVLSVVTDRAGRWLRALECCARCAAAQPGARAVAEASRVPASRKGDSAAPPRAVGAVAPPAFVPPFPTLPQPVLRTPTRRRLI